MVIHMDQGHLDKPEPTDAEVEAHLKASRERRRADAAAIGINRDFVENMVATFYGHVRDDALLGPIFAAKVEDWPRHLSRMESFWRSLLMNSGEVSANHMVATHLALPGIEEAHFTRWLELFYATLRDIERHADATGLIGERARKIADSLLTAIATRNRGVRGLRAGENLPRLWACELRAGRPLRRR